MRNKSNNEGLEEWVDIIQEWHQQEAYPPIRPLAEKITNALNQQKELLIKEIDSKIEEARGNDYANLGMGGLDYHEKNAVDAYVETLKSRVGKFLTKLEHEDKD